MKNWVLINEVRKKFLCWKWKVHCLPGIYFSIDFVKKLVTEMSDEDLNKVKENFDIAIQQRDEQKRKI